MDITKLLLLGGAAYLGYSYLKPSTVSAVPAGGIQPAENLSAANPSTTAGLILAEARKNNFTMGNADDWGWYFQRVRGIPAPAPNDLGFTEQNVGQLLTFPEWWAQASAHGLSGYRRGNTFVEIG